MYGRINVNKLDRDEKNRIRVEIVAHRNKDDLMLKISSEGGNTTESSETINGTHIKAYVPENSIRKIKDHWMEHCLL
jgi:hypothetical protein